MFGNPPYTGLVVLPHVFHSSNCNPNEPLSGDNSFMRTSLSRCFWVGSKPAAQTTVPSLQLINGGATMSKSTKYAFALAVVLMFSTSLFADSTFINGELATGTTTTFSDTVNGLTATFISPADPGGFVTGTNFFSFAGWQILLDPGPASASGIPLVIA